jgi:hypothetical protein
MAIEPLGWDVTANLPGRWIYAVDGRAGGVMVLDAETLDFFDLSIRDPMEWRSEIVVPGLAQDVVIARVWQQEAPTTSDPTVFHGTFGFIVSSVGETFAVDIEDWSNPDCWKDGAIGGTDPGDYLDDIAHCPRHVLRNASQTGDHPGPYWSAPPALFDKADISVGYTDEPLADYPRFDGFRDRYPFPPPDDDPSYGVWFFEYPGIGQPDPRRAVSQTWIVDYEAVIPWTDGTGGQVQAGTEEGTFQLVDRGMPFCARGVLAGDHLIINDGPGPLDETTPCGDFGSSENPAKPEYRIREAHNNSLVLEPIAADQPLPTAECFPWLVTYEVRVSGQWLVRGDVTGFQHHVITGGTDGTECVEDPDVAACPPWDSCTQAVGDPLADPPIDLRCLFSGRAVETPPGSDGVLYRNPYICFSMKQGEAVDSSGALVPQRTARRTRYELKAAGGFRSVSVDTGLLPVAVAADTTGRTGPALVVVDSSSDGLIRVDLDGFDATDNWP